MRSFGVAVLAFSLIASSTFAAELGALAPGRAAGVKTAQADNTTFYVITAGAVLVGGVTFLIATDHSTLQIATITGGNSVLGVNGINAPVSTGTQ